MFTHPNAALPATSYVHLGFISILRSLACFRIAASIIDHVHSKALMISRFFAHMRAATAATDLVALSSSLILRSFAHLNVAASTPNFLHTGLFTLLRGCSCLELSLSLFGMARLGFVFSLSVLKYTHSGSFPSLRILTCPETFPFAIDSLHLSTSSLLQNSGHCSLLSFTFGLARSDTFLVVLNTIHPVSFSSPRTLPRSGITPLVPDLLHSELFLSFRRFAHTRSLLAVFGSSRTRSTLLVLNLGRLDLIPLSRSFAYLSAFVPMMDLVVFDSLSLMRFLFRSGSVAPTLDHVHVILMFPSRSFAHSGLASLASNHLHTDSLLLFRSFVRIGAAMFTPDYLHLGVMLSLKRFARCRVSMSTLNYLHLSVLLLSRSFVHADPAALVLDYLHPKSLPSPKSFM